MGAVDAGDHVFPGNRMDRVMQLEPYRLRRAGELDQGRKQYRDEWESRVFHGICGAGTCWIFNAAMRSRRAIADAFAGSSRNTTASSDCASVNSLRCSRTLASPRCAAAFEGSSKMASRK